MAPELAHRERVDSFVQQRQRSEHEPGIRNTGCIPIRRFYKPVQTNLTFLDAQRIQHPARAISLHQSVRTTSCEHLWLMAASLSLLNKAVNTPLCAGSGAMSYYITFILRWYGSQLMLFMRPLTASHISPTYRPPKVWGCQNKTLNVSSPDCYCSA